MARPRIVRPCQVSTADADPIQTLDFPSVLWCRMGMRSEEHTSELQSRLHLVCRLLLEKKKILCCRGRPLGSSVPITRSSGRLPGRDPRAVSVKTSTRTPHPEHIPPLTRTTTHTTPTPL